MACVQGRIWARQVVRLCAHRVAKSRQLCQRKRRAWAPQRRDVRCIVSFKVVKSVIKPWWLACNSYFQLFSSNYRYPWQCAEVTVSDPVFFSSSFSSSASSAKSCDSIHLHRFLFRLDKHMGVCVKCLILFIAMCQRFLPLPASAICFPNRIRNLELLTHKSCQVVNILAHGDKTGLMYDIKT